MKERYSSTARWIIFTCLLLVFATLLTEGHSNRKKSIQRTYNYGYALKFDGNNEFVSLPGFTFGSPFSVEFLGNGGTVFESSDSNGRNLIRVSVTTSNKLNLLVISDKGKETSVTSDDSLNTNQWHYVIITVSDTGSVTFYRQNDNGNDDTSVKNLSNGYVPWTVFRSVNYLGKSRTSGVRAFTGDLDEVRLWNKRLSDDEIEAGRLRPLRGDEDALIAFYDFNQASGLVLTDVSINELHGALGGNDAGKAPTWIVSGFAPSASCAMWSNSAKTFDKKSISLSSSGIYWMTNTTSTTLDSIPDVIAQTRLSARRKSNKVSVSPDGFAFQTISDYVIFDFDLTTKSDTTVTWNGQLVTDPSFVGDTGISIVKTITNTKTNAHYIEFLVPFAFTGKITVNPKNGDTKVEIKLNENPFKNNDINGVCGNYDGWSFNDVGAPISSTWEVTGPSLFSEAYSFGDPITEFICDIEDYPSLYSASQPICENTTWVSADLQEKCYYDVCVAGDLSGAVRTAEETYQDCLENSSNTGGNDLCNPPCPNFCSFNGQCNNGQCTCNAPYIGKDCSQQAAYPCFTASWPGEEELIIEPFSGTDTVVNHYKYGYPRYSSTNTNNEIKDTSVVYLYQQLGTSASTNKASLVVINDIPRDDSGGKASLGVVFTNDVGGPLTGVSLAVKDDSNDKYNTTGLNLGGVVSATWAWSECCTDGFALTNLPISSDFCTALSFSNLQGISQVVVASRDFNGDEEVTSFPMGQTLTICGKNCTNQCVQHTSCDTCMADSNCGWCSDSEVCVPGSAQGPDSGRCQAWRYSFTDSRILSRQPGFPVDPSSLEYFLNQTQPPLTVTFSVRVPENDDVPLEALILQDISAAFASDLSLLRASVVQTYLRLSDIYPAARLAIGAFSDKPKTPYGSPSLPDYTYTIRSSLTTNPAQIQSALNTLTVATGGDEPNSQLEALLLAAKRSEVGWSDSARKVIILITKSSYHIPVVNDSTFIDNNGDGEFPDFGATENYPTVAQVRSALLGANIIPLFITTPALAPLYQNLVDQFGFGSVSSYTVLNSESIFSETLQSLSDMGGIIQPIIYQQGDIVSSITPPLYTGISSQTRVTFQVTLSDTSTEDAIIVVPGFGSVTLSHLATDNPVPDANTDLAVLTSDDIVLELGGTTVYNDILSTIITQLPHGAVFQYNEGSRGTQLTGPGPWPVSDPRGRVLYNAFGLSNTSSIQYFLKDSCQACSTFASFQISTVLAKSLPEATPNSGSCSEDGSVSINLNGTSSNSASLVAKVTVLPTGGKLFVGASEIISVDFDVPSGVVTYYPDADQHGSESSGFLYDQFYFTVSDSEGQAVQAAVVTLYVTPEPDSPVARDVTASGSEDQSTTFTLDASDVDGDTLSYVIDSISAGLICVGDVLSCSWTNSVSFTTSSPTIHFKAPPEANGAFQLTYRAQDSVLISDTAYVNITISPVNDLPVATAGADSTNEDTSKPFTLSISDIDNLPSEIGPVICSWNGPGTLLDSSGVVIPYTSTFYNLPLGSNVVTFTPAANENSSPYATVSFAGRDSEGRSSCVAFVISVSAANDAPQSFSDTVTVVEATQSVITLRGSDIDTPTLTFYLCSPPLQGSLANMDNSSVDNVITGVSGQTANVQYTPVGNQNGLNYASFSFKTNDGEFNSSCSTITINVAGVQNSPSTAGTVPSPVITDEDTSLVVTLNCTDPDGDSLTFKIEDPLPAASNIVLGEVATGANITSSRLISGNQIRILPYLNWNGNTAFTFSCTDGNNTATPSTVTVTVSSINDRPLAFDQTVVTLENQDMIILLSGSDLETPSASLTYRIQNTVSRGNLSICVDQACTAVSGPALNNSPVSSGAVVFIPDDFTNDNNTGVYTSFTFLTVDGDLETSVNPGTITIGVTPVNYPPQAITPNATVIAPYNQDIVLFLSASDPNNDIPLFVYVSSVGLVGRLFQYNLTTGGRGPQIQGNSVLVEDDEYRIIYTTQTGAKSSGAVDVISYTVADPAGLTGSGQVNVTLPLNNPPSANATVQHTINEDTTATIYLTGVDFDDLDNVFTAYISELPTSGTLFQFDGETEINMTGTAVTDLNNRVLFVPGLNENGNGSNGNFYASFSYYVVSQNTSQQSLPATLSVFVTPVNDLPILTMTGVSIPERVYSTFTASAYDPDGDPIVIIVRYASGSVLTLFQILNNGSKGPALSYNFNGDANVTNPDRLLGVLPVSGFSGLAAPGFRACDWSGCTPNTPIVFNVFLVPEAPTASNVIYIFSQPLVGGYVPISFLFSDPDDFPVKISTLTATLLTLPARGRLYRSFSLAPETEITTNRSIDLPNPNVAVYYDPETFTEYGVNFANFTYIVTDETNLVSSVAQITIHMNPPCSTPAIVTPQGANGLINTTAGQQTTFYWSIVDDDPIDVIFVVKTQPLHGKLFTRGLGQSGPSTPYPDTNLLPDGTNGFELMVYSMAEDNIVSYVDYVPNPGYSSFGSGPDCFQYQYFTCTFQDLVLWPEVFTGCIYVQDVNTAPSVTITSNYTLASASTINIMGVSVSDDSLNFPITVSLDGVGASSVSLVSQAGVGYTQDTATTATITGTVSAINTALSQGISFAATSSGTLTISVNDGGYFSEVAGGAATPLTAQGTVTITISESNSLNSAPAATGAFVGGTSIVSAAVYGVYRTLKSKKLIPEEADPWENDDAFDATTENPLYATGVTPIYSSSL